MVTVKDVATTAAFIEYLKATDALVFDRPIRAKVEFGSVCEHLRYRKTHLEEAYLVRESGLYSYLKSYESDSVWLNLLSKIGHETNSIGAYMVMQALAAHEVRHRLQANGLVVLYTPENTVSILRDLGFGYQPDYKHLDRDTAKYEYDADIVTWSVLTKIFDGGGEIEQIDLKNLLLSSHENLYQLLK